MFYFLNYDESICVAKGTLVYCLDSRVRYLQTQILL